MDHVVNNFLRRELDKGPTAQISGSRAFGSTAVKAFPLSDVQAMLGHAHITTTMRYVHHRPGKDDAQRLAAAFGGHPVSSFVSPTRDTERDSEERSDRNDGA